MNLQMYSEVIAAVAVLFYLTAILSAVEAIMRVRTAQGAIAWAISLLTVPYIALPCYWIFGRTKFEGYLEQKQEIERQTRQLLQRTHNALDDYLLDYPNDLPLYNSLYNLSRTPATRGNHVELLINGQATFDSILGGLETARRYILIEFYIIRDDDLGARFTRILSQKAQSGVKVFLLYDEIGSRNFHRTRMCKQLRQTGVRVAAFNTTQGHRNRFQLNFRNHRKIVVVDGEQAWVGGHNIGDEYLGLSKRHGFWRDTHLRLRGPAVLGTELAFATDWRWATRSPLDIQLRLESRPCGDANVLVFASDPASTMEEAGLMFHQVIVEARHRIWIASPYFVPDRGIISALQLAALRGVDVRLIIPDQPDGPVVGMANWAFTRELLPAGVKVYRYQGGFMHQKVLLMDNTVAGVGTANFDNRSFRLNFEITLLVHNAEFCDQVQTMLEEDINHSRRVTPQEIADKPPWFPLGMGIARLFAPIL
ncbi:cardiolipin synthase [Parahaliea mediterranea]|uniref:Cardiolipin synthase n=1 Tax=Parahaliea mediterranea TaxID=651086 RepID=A0A939IKL5_9GAMM|nr:cardiolipin synthase [Parahaliea mediterranea]MBN7798884.1 cardiolipin synthase [Parahaliea mediterranea]